MTHTGAVTGEVGGYIRFTNRGTAPCRLSGWPKVIAVNAAGKPTTVRRALHGTMIGAWQYVPPLPVLRLRPGASAYAVVAAGDNPVYGSSPCPSYRLLRITPPRNSQQVTLSAWLPNDVTYLPACTGFNGSREIEVSAVVRLSDLH